ncbi:FAD-binding oxidoreductase [Variovorax paradoxus]|nr:FAD-binding oxidoreductase [Variovorax paradoxus]
MKLASYWTDTTTRFEGLDPAGLDARADVVVIGAGFTGLSAALALARRGAKVVVLEAGLVASEASGRNGGHCNNGLPYDFGSVARQLGVEQARDLYHAYDSAVDSVERVVREEGIDCDFRRNGKIKLAAKPHHFAKLEKAYELLHRDVDPDTSLVGPEAIGSEVGSGQFYGGIVMHKSAQMHMGRFGAGLAAAAQRRGARIFENTAVAGLTRLSANAIRVKTEHGTVEAAQVLVATGPSRHGPFGYFRRRIIPVGSFVVTTEPLSQQLAASIMPGRRNATTTKNVGHYFRLTPDNRLVFGGRARFALSDPASDAKSGAVLERDMKKLFPQLRDIRIDYCWGGVVDMTADRLPRAGEARGLHYAMGYSGSGTQMSVYMGQHMARAMDGDSAANPLRGLPWRAIPGHLGPPWFLPLVGAYYRALDWVS